MGARAGPLEAADRNDKAHTCLVQDENRLNLEVFAKLNIFNLKDCPLS